MIGFKGDGNSVTVRNCKWISSPSESSTTHLGSMLDAATLLQHWDRPTDAAVAAAAPLGVPRQLPLALLREAYSRYRAMYAAGETIALD